MPKPFVETHAAAGALLLATILASSALEAAVTVRERLRTRSGARARAAIAALVEALTARGGGDATADRGTKGVLIGATVAALVLAWWSARDAPGARMPGSGWIPVGLGLPLMWLGVGLRLWAISTLGRFFRRVVVVQEGHVVVGGGPYRAVRHPAYAGNLLAVAGLGLALGNWLGLAVLLVLPFLGHLPRIRVEEAELVRALGESYRAYAATTRRLVPGVW